jgi:hypothetical protein
MRGSRHVPPSINGTPQRRQNTPSTASSSITRRSHHSASSSPPATACPEIAAITGFSSCSLVGPIGPKMSCGSPLGSRTRDSSHPVATALRSAPAQNVPSAPHSTVARNAASRSISRKAATSRDAVAESTALRASGRSRITVATAPDRSMRTESFISASPFEPTGDLAHLSPREAVARGPDARGCVG